MYSHHGAEDPGRSLSVTLCCFGPTSLEHESLRKPKNSSSLEGVRTLFLRFTMNPRAISIFRAAGLRGVSVASPWSSP